MSNDPQLEANLRLIETIADRGPMLIDFRVTDPAIREQWIDEATGLQCVVSLEGMHVLCGYVGIDTSHPWFGADDRACALPESCGGRFCEHAICEQIEVYWGLSFSGRLDHLAGLQHPELWYFGFDEGHASGLLGMAGMKAECRKLAEQLHDVNAGDTVQNTVHGS